MMRSTNGKTSVLRVSVHGPLVENGTLPVDHLQKLSRHLQKALQEIAGQLARSAVTAPKAADVRRGLRLSVASIRPGSVVIDFDYAVVPPEAQALGIELIRLEAIETLIGGIAELTTHGYLPTGWSPQALRELRGLTSMLGAEIEVLVIGAPELPDSPAAELHSNLTPRLEKMIERYDLGRGKPAYSVGAPPPLKRRHRPTFPLFDSGDPDLAKEAGEAYGSEAGET